MPESAKTQRQEFDIASVVRDIVEPYLGPDARLVNRVLRRS